MSEQGNRRPVVLAVTGVAATLVLFLAYRKYAQAATANATASSLRRSNAVRRSRRRWRRGHPPRELEENPIESAVRNLRRRVADGPPYGRYDNRLVFETEDEALDGGLFDLLPLNLPNIFRILTQVRPMSASEKSKLKFHINAIFMRNFLQEEFPLGWIIGEDVETLVEELGSRGIEANCIRVMVDNFDHGREALAEQWDVRDGAEATTAGNFSQSDGPMERPSTQSAIEALAGPPQDDSSDNTDDEDDASDPGGSQNMLDLLYHIASEQAKREGYIHRNVRCNSCGNNPIQGIRFQCVNCYDYDLCEDCEAQQVHNMSHIFYKIRIPAPPRSHIKQALPVLYPGVPNAFPSSMPRVLQRWLVVRTGMDKTEMEASYEQFKCLAGEPIPVEQDPARLGMAINRQNFDMYFTPNSADRPPAPNLIYDRIFAYYDSNNDGVITLDEYIVGIWGLTNKSRGARLRRLFMGYDLDADGYVDRKDFLRIFRAYYASSRELIQEVVSLTDELNDDIRDVVRGSQPISAAFGAASFTGHVSREGQDKGIDSEGDLVITSGPHGVLQNDTEMRGDRSRAIGNRAVQGQAQTHPFRSFRQRPQMDEPLLEPPSPSTYSGLDLPFARSNNDQSLDTPDPDLHVYGWPPPQTPEAEDIIHALGVNVPLDDVTDPVDRSRVIYAHLQRLDTESDRTLSDRRAAALGESWRRRQFYLDEEEGLTKPPGYTEPDSSDEEAASIDEPSAAVAATMASSSRRQSMRSRSSSKVRFDDSAIDTDHETRSNTSSRSIPVNERWGGFELGGPEKDVGREIMYQAVQQGYNELLDPIFKKKEDDAMEAIGTKILRTKWAKEIEQHEIFLKKKAEAKAEFLRRKNLLRTQALFSNSVDGTVKGMPEGGQAPASTSTDEADAMDHIQIIFGSSPAKPKTPTKPVGHAASSSQLSEDGQLLSSDPTLPQHKPNDAAFMTPQSHPPKIFPASVSIDPAMVPPSELTLTDWVNHRKIDIEAQKRGGYGKLSYREFCRIVITAKDRQLGAVDSAHELGHGHGLRSNNGVGTGNAGTDVGAGSNTNAVGDELDDDELEQAWTSTADLGSFNFLDTWLEMAQF